MSLCGQCGLQLHRLELCPHHHMAYGDEWAVGNRVMCDFFHRGIITRPYGWRADDFDWWPNEC